MAERPKDRSFSALREALSLPAPERGAAFWEYPHKDYPKFKMRVHPPNASGQVLRQWAMRAKFTPAGGKEEEDRRTFGHLVALDKSQTAVSYDDALEKFLARVRVIETLKTSPAAVEKEAAEATRLTVEGAWALHGVETRTQRGPTTEKEVGQYGRYFQHLADVHLDKLSYAFWAKFVDGLGVAKLYNPDGQTWTKMPRKLAEATIIGIMNLASKLTEIAHRYSGLPGKEKSWNPARDAKKLIGTPNVRTGSIPLTKIAEVWRAADVLCAGWARDQLRLYLLTALRASLLTELQFKEVDARARVLRISPHKKGTKRRGAKTAENAADLIIPISATALAIIQARRPWAPDPHGPVWYTVSQPGGKVAKGGAPRIPHYSDPRSNWAHIEKAVLEGVHFMRHDMRRTFANIAVGAKADMLGASLLMMHAPRTLAAVLGLPEITVDYMNTVDVQQQMRSASDSVEKYILGLLNGSVIPSSAAHELPPALAASVDGDSEDGDD